MTDLFNAAGEIVDAVIAKRGSVRNLALNHPTVSNKKKLFAIATRTLESTLSHTVVEESDNRGRETSIRESHSTIRSFIKRYQCTSFQNCFG